MHSKAERMLIHQASQTNMTLHNLFWNAEKRIGTALAHIFPQKPLNPIKAKQKSPCDWTALNDDCRLSQVDSQILEAIDVFCTTGKSTEKSKLCPAISIT